MAAKKVLVIGELNVDIILNEIQGLPEIGKEKLANTMEVTLGSSSAIFASNLSSLGANVAFLGKIGNDQFGKLTIDSLKQKKVNTDLIIMSDEVNTGATIVLNYDMDRAMITYPGAMEHLSKDDITASILDNYDHVHVSSIFLQPAILKDLIEIFHLIKSKGLTISCDPQWDPSEQWNINLNQILPLIDVFLPNIKEIQAISNCQTLEEIGSKYGELAEKIVVKDGENGSHWFENHSVRSIPPFLNEKVVDCIGAGDSYNAGFIFQYILNKPRQSCAEFGSITGALNTTAPGGTSAFTSRSVISDNALKYFGYEIEL